MELHKNQDKGGYSGHERAVQACSYLNHDFKHWRQSEVVRHCSIELGVEISTLTESRIRAASGYRLTTQTLDCKKCTYEISRVPRPFVWIPE